MSLVCLEDVILIDFEVLRPMLTRFKQHQIAYIFLTYLEQILKTLDPIP